MRIQLTGHHVELTNSLRDYVNNKFERLERHNEKLADAHVVLTVEKMQQRAEATIHLARANVFADAESEDMYAAIDSLVDKLDRQLKKHKEKITDHRS